MSEYSAARQIWIFVGESDQWRGGPLYLALLETLKREGVAGATALRGIAGFGAHNLIHTSSLVELSSDLPIAITFVDSQERVERVLPQLTAMVSGGLIVTLPVEVVKDGHRDVGPFPAHLTVADVMTRDPAQVSLETPVAEVVTLLIDRALRALPVVDERRHVVGIITDGDLLVRGVAVLPLDLQRALPLDERAAQIARLSGQPQRAAHLMTPGPFTLAATTPLAHAAATMADHNLKRMPVVDDQHCLVGMVSRDDLLATVAEGLRQRPSAALQLPPGAPTSVGAIMLRSAPSVHRDTPLAEALERLLETEQRRVVVVDDDQRVVGIITDGDVLRRGARRVRPQALSLLAAWLGGGARPDALEIAARGRTAADVMTSPALTVTPDAPIADAIQLMMAHRVKRLPVVDAGGRLVGVVGRAGVLAALRGPPHEDAVGS